VDTIILPGGPQGEASTSERAGNVRLVIEQATNSEDLQWQLLRCSVRIRASGWIHHAFRPSPCRTGSINRSASSIRRRGQLVPFLVKWPPLLAHLNPLELRRSAAALEAEFLQPPAPPEEGGQHPAA
jgi:hypothetical protein